MAAFYPGLTGGFQYDDYPTIVENALIKHINLDLLWKSNPDRFLTNLSFAWNYRFSGLNPVSWHTVNLLIHVVNAFLIYRLTLLVLAAPRIRESIPAQRTTGLALAAGLIFLLHPLQTQAVHYVVQRSTLLAALFYLLTLIFYFRARLDNDDRFHGYALVCAFIGMTAKEDLMTLPVVIILCELFLFGISRQVSLKRTGIFLLYCAPMVLIAVFFWGTGQLLSAASSGLAVMDFQVRLLTQLKVLLTYLKLFVYPVGFNLDYDYPPARGWGDPSVWTAAAVWVTVIAGALTVSRRRPAAAFGVVWFLVTLAPVVLFPFEDVIFEHWTYLALYGLILAAVTVIGVTFLRNKMSAVLLAGVLDVLLLLTQGRSQLWGDPPALLADTIAKSPRKARPYHNLGAYYLHQNQFNQAEHFFQKTLAMDPDFLQAYNNLGLIYMERGDHQRALEVFEKIVSRTQGYTDAYLNLAAAHMQIGNDELALQQLQRIRPFAAMHPAVYLGMGNLLWKNGRIEEALEQFNTALWLNPSSPEAHLNLGNLHFSIGNYYEALTHYEAAVGLDAHFAEAYNNIGYLQFYFRDFPAAADNFRLAIRYNPSFPDAYLNLANALYEMGRTEESRRHAASAAHLYRKTGNLEKAQDITRKLNLSVQ